MPCPAARRAGFWRRRDCGLSLAGYHLLVPRTRDHIRPAVDFVRQHRQSGDGIIVLSAEEFLCYWRQPDCDVRLGLNSPADIAPDWNRFWIVWSFSHPRQPRLDVAGELERVEMIAVGQPDQSYIGTGGAAVLFQRRPPP